MDISANVAEQSGRKIQPMRIDDNTLMIDGHAVKIRSNTDQDEVKKGLWNATKFEEDGQIVAGEVDAAQEAFLQQTEMIPDDPK